MLYLCSKLFRYYNYVTRRKKGKDGRKQSRQLEEARKECIHEVGKST